jgi:hypothetical protein
LSNSGLVCGSFEHPKYADKRKSEYHTRLQSLIGDTRQYFLDVSDDYVDRLK